MSTCATCGRRIENARPSTSVCASCARRAALHTTRAVDDRAVENPVAMAARLHELATMVGEGLDPESIQVLEAVARGNTRVYEAEVTRLANRFIATLEKSWD